MKDKTKSLHAGYTPGDGEPRVLPIYQSTTYKFEHTERMGELFDMPTAHIYSRFSNPTVEAVEKKLAELEGGVGALCTASGQAATLLSILNICSAGDSIVSTVTVYGGTVNLFAVRLKKLGIECIFVDPNASIDELRAAFKPNTKAVFAESLSNPTLVVLDIQKFAQVAHENKVPLIIDNTFPTPALCKPFEYGADIITHSTSKYMDGHAVQVGGVVIDGGTFDWSSGKYPDFTERDESYHGVIYARDFGREAYIIKARMQLMRDFGVYPSAHSAFLLNLGLETLYIRMEEISRNALAVAKHLEVSDKISWVRYPGLLGDPYHDLATKYLSTGSSGVICISIKGGRECAVRFMDGLKLISNEIHVADIRTSVLHPASTTHRQLTDDQLVSAGIDTTLVRVSVGLEHIEDIIEDLDQSLREI